MPLIETETDWDWTGHIGFWHVAVVLICCANHTYYDEKRRHFEPLLFTREKGGLEVNAENIGCVLMFHELNAGWNCNRKIGDKCSESVAQFRQFGTTQTQQTSMHIQIKIRLNAWENNIKMNLHIIWEGVDRNHLGQNRDQQQVGVKGMMNLLVP